MDRDCGAVSTAEDGAQASVPVQPHAAFSMDEVNRIIQGFRASPYYAYYADYVFYRFGMGTRPGEASGLKWKHISADFQSVWIGESYSRGTTGSTKTKKARTLNLTASVATMLKARKKEISPKSDDELVFTSATGLGIDDRNFRRRAWKTVLADVGIPYRKPYTCRKTAATLGMRAGANYIDMAAALGHDPHTMHKHYIDAFHDQSVFVELEY